MYSPEWMPAANCVYRLRDVQCQGGALVSVAGAYRCLSRVHTIAPRWTCGCQYSYLQLSGGGPLHLTHISKPGPAGPYNLQP
jgi:hypothetical protein